MPRPALALVVLALVAGCTRRAADGLPPGVEVEDLPQSEAWSTTLRTSTDGVRDIEIETPYLARYTRDSTYTYLGPPPGDTTAAPVTIRLYDEAGEPSGSVRAREVWITPGERGAPDRLVAEGAVRATQTGRAEVEAARVTVVGDSLVAVGDVRAQVEAGGATVQAPRLVVAGASFVATGGVVAQLTEAAATVRARTVEGSGGRYAAEGGVRVLASGGRTLEAGRVVWDEGAARFSAPGAFSFDGPGERVRGVGLSASSDLTRYTFRRAAGQLEVQE